jgi:hypothetical protein
MAKENTEQKKGRRVLDEETRQHMREARAEMRNAFKSMVPPEFIKHRRAARREMLLAARSLIDHARERLESKEKA